MVSYDVAQLLERLSTDAWEQAWQEFVSIYSPVIQRVVRFLEHDEDRAADAYAYVCETLWKDRCARLRSFQSEGPARFETWLRVVVRRAYLDWRRAVGGRHRPFRSIERLPALEREVYREVFERDRSRSEALEIVRRSYPDVSELHLAEIVDSLYETLTRRQRWILASRRTPVIPIAGDREGAGHALEPVDPAPNAEMRAQASELLRQVRDALARLEPETRLVLKLRFDQELSLREVAALLELSNPQAAARRVDAALISLRALLPSGDEPEES